jgi:hypothetical protein
MINKFKAITDLIINFIAESLGTKVCVLVFCIIAGLPLHYQPPTDLLGWCSYISQTVIQLVALSILAIVAKNEGLKQAKLLQETHDVTMESHDELHLKLDAIIDKLEVTYGPE